MLLDVINKAMNKYFAADPEIATQLNQFNDQALLLKLTDIKQDFLITPKDSTLVVEEVTEQIEAENITTTIQSNIVSLLRLSLGANFQSLLQTDSIKIEGDTEFANELQNIVKEVEIDWEEIASKYVGDPIAYQLGIFAKRFHKYRKRSTENFRLDVSEYLQEESRIVPTRVEINKFVNDVDNLGADVERLEVRIERVLQAQNN